MACTVSNGHAIDDVTWPSEFKVVILISLWPVISYKIYLADICTLWAPSSLAMWQFLNRSNNERRFLGGQNSPAIGKMSTVGIITTVCYRAACDLLSTNYPPLSPHATTTTTTTTTAINATTTVLRPPGLCPGLPEWAGTRRYRQSGFTGATESEWQWHQLGHMQICTSPQTDNHVSILPLSFLQAECPSCHPTNSVKHWRQSTEGKYLTIHMIHF